MAHTQIPPCPTPTHTQSISPASTRASGDTGSSSPAPQGRYWQVTAEQEPTALRPKAETPPAPCPHPAPPTPPHPRLIWFAAWVPAGGLVLTASPMSSELRDTRVSSPESVPSAQAPSGPAFIFQGGRRDCQRREKGNQSHSNHKAAKGRDTPSLSVHPLHTPALQGPQDSAPRREVQSRTNRIGAGKAAVSCFLKSSSLSISLAFQSGDVQTAASEFGLKSGGQDGAVPHRHAGPSSAKLLPAGRRLAACEQFHSCRSLEKHSSICPRSCTS